MRLINTQTLKLEEYLNDKVQPYAILSHRWSDSEMSLLDMQNLRLEEPVNSQGFVKIKYACEQAIRDGYRYVWVDTCCINKDSSADLSEAINSMYRWYQRAAVCYVFLSDVDTAGDPEAFDVSSRQLQSSEWFDRGWTLQELLAPRNVHFYDKHWHFIGTKSSLSGIISTRTKIAADMLCGTKTLPDYSIAQRMSWASRRVTTRDEDIAYCLLGIFDVNMPLLYGEGEKAFIRLQEEIIEQLDDHSIFAWDIRRTDQPGLLADSPSAFVNCFNVISTSSRRGRTPYTMTNRGLSLKLMAVPWALDTYAASLDCTYEHHAAERLGICLRRLDEDDQYARVAVDGGNIVVLPRFVWENDVSEITGIEHFRRLIEINVRQKITTLNTNAFQERVHGFRIAKEICARSFGTHYEVHGLLDTSREVDNMVEARIMRHFRPIDFLSIECQNSQVRVMSLEFDFDHNPVCLLAKSYELIRKYHLEKRLYKICPWLKSNCERSREGTFVWSMMSRGEVEELPHHPGVWIIKGDRIRGVRASVRGFGLLRIERKETECGRLVWDVRRVPVSGVIEMERVKLARTESMLVLGSEGC